MQYSYIVTKVNIHKKLRESHPHMIMSKYMETMHGIQSQIQVLLFTHFVLRHPISISSFQQVSFCNSSLVNSLQFKNDGLHHSLVLPFPFSLFNIFDRLLVLVIISPLTGIILPLRVRGRDSLQMYNLVACLCMCVHCGHKIENFPKSS